MIRLAIAHRCPDLAVECRLMALAIHFDRLIRDGKVKDYAEVARLGGVTRARVTQVMNLLSLAPAVQEALLSGDIGDETERTLR
jgi:hypothetical protein